MKGVRKCQDPFIGSGAKRLLTPFLFAFKPAETATALAVEAQRYGLFKFQRDGSRAEGEANARGPGMHHGESSQFAVVQKSGSQAFRRNTHIAVGILYTRNTPISRVAAGAQPASSHNPLNGYRECADSGPEAGISVCRKI
jgi:hypothetical protein